MTNELYMKIREERIKQGLSQKELGEMVGLPQQAINRIEQGQRKLDIELFEKLCKVLKIKKIGSFSINFISSFYKMDYDPDVDGPVELEDIAPDDVPDYVPDYVPDDVPDYVPDDLLKNNLLEHYNKLNNTGKEKAIERVGELTEIKKYTEPGE